MLKQGKKQIKLYMLTLAFSVLVIITLLFFLGDVLTADGREYIPNSASNIALALCVLWQCVLVIGIYRLQKKIKEFSSGWIKKIVTITATGAAIFLVMRNLSEDELNEAIHKYGDPDNYYNQY